MHPRYKSHTSTAIAATAAETDFVHGLSLCTVYTYLAILLQWNSKQVVLFHFFGKRLTS